MALLGVNEIGQKSGTRLTGYMQKRGSLFPTWHRRSFILTEDGRLSYHENEVTQDKKTLGQYDLKQCDLVPLSRRQAAGAEVKSITIVVKGSNDRFFYMFADSVEDAEKWRNAISFWCEECTPDVAKLVKSRHP